MTGLRVWWAVIQLGPGSFAPRPFSGPRPEMAVDVHALESEARTDCRLRESTYRIEIERAARAGALEGESRELFG
jgi:hypothetical protein